MYYDGILRAQGEPSPQRPFDIERLRTKGLFRKLLARALEDPRWLLTLARLIKPNVKFFGWVYVTKDEDVRDVIALLRLNYDRAIARHGVPAPAA